MNTNSDVSPRTYGGKRKKGTWYIYFLLGFLCVLFGVIGIMWIGRGDASLEKSVEDLFSRHADQYEGIVDIETTSARWMGDHGFHIFIPDQDGIFIYTPLTDETMQDRLHPVVLSISPEINTLMSRYGFSKNEANSSRSFDDKRYYDHIEAFEDDQRKCVFVGGPDSALRTVDDDRSSEKTWYRKTHVVCFDTDVFIQHENEQLPLLKDLEIHDHVISDIFILDNFARFVVSSVQRGGYYAVARFNEESGTWFEIHSGQEPPYCDVVHEHNIPFEIEGECISIGGEVIKNTFGY